MIENPEPNSTNKTLVVIPTYNEVDNIRGSVRRVRIAVPYAHILIVDDRSPDGTGDLADQLATQDQNVRVLHRQRKDGLGAAYLAAFDWGIKYRYDVLVEMDADGSHQPEQLPRILEVLDAGNDLVLGSRWVPGGRVQNWSNTAKYCHAVETSTFGWP